MTPVVLVVNIAGPRSRPGCGTGDWILGSQRFGQYHPRWCSRVLEKDDSPSLVEPPLYRFELDKLSNPIHIWDPLQSQYCAPIDEHSSFRNNFEFENNNDKRWELEDSPYEDRAKAANTANEPLPVTQRDYTAYPEPNSPSKQHTLPQ